MNFAGRFSVAAFALAVATSQAVAQGRPGADPDWPCQQVKTAAFSLASVWTGPPVDLTSETWRDEPEVADLVAKMTQRRVPIEDAEKAIADFKAKGGADADAKLLQAFGAAFTELTRQRSQILEGLDRFGRKQHEMAARIRRENAAVQSAADQGGAQAQPSSDALQRLQWDLRVFDDRRRTVGYVCDAPVAIERRIGAIARAVQNAL